MVNNGARSVGRTPLLPYSLSTHPHTSRAHVTVLAALTLCVYYTYPTHKAHLYDYTDHLTLRYWQYNFDRALTLTLTLTLCLTLTPTRLTCSW